MIASEDAVTALQRLQAQHELVDYDEGAIISKMVNEIDMRKELDKIKQ